MADASGLLGPLLTLGKGLTPLARRLLAERKAAQTGAAPDLDFMAVELGHTLNRLANIEKHEQWWEDLLRSVGHQFVAPDCLKIVAISEWLSDPEVRDDFLLLARRRILADSTGAPHEAESRLGESYSRYTGELAALAHGSVQTIVAILTAAYASALASGASNLSWAGLVQESFGRLDSKLKAIEEALERMKTDSVTGQASPVAGITNLGIPRPPSPYLPHPYPLSTDFGGRVVEQLVLTEWLDQTDQPLFALTGIGGMGKSALVWVWMRRAALSSPAVEASTARRSIEEPTTDSGQPAFEAVMWWSFYEQDSDFSAFLRATIGYLTGGAVNPEQMHSRAEAVDVLLALLQEKKVLLILDGFERELRAYPRHSAPYQGDASTIGEIDELRRCTDFYAASFLRRAASLPLAAKLVLTTRLLPLELENLAGCRELKLGGLDPNDTVQLFRAHGIAGTARQLIDAGQAYEHHPLALRLLAGAVKSDETNAADITLSHKYQLTEQLHDGERHHILAVAYELLDDNNRLLIGRLAALRGPTSSDVISSLSPRPERIGDDLKTLQTLGLLLYDEARSKYDIHPVVRQYAYDRLIDKQGVHTVLAEYFAGLGVPIEEKVTTLDDLQPLIELYHHCARLSRFDDAYRFYIKYLKVVSEIFNFLQTDVVFLRALFAEGEDHPARLSRTEDRIASSLLLGHYYEEVGQLDDAERLYGLLFEELESMEDLEQYADAALCAYGLARCQMRQGKLMEAEIPLVFLRGCQLALFRDGMIWTSDLTIMALLAAGRWEEARLAAYRGRVKEANELVDSYLEVLKNSSFGPLAEPDPRERILRAEVEAIAGDAESALRLVQDGWRMRVADEPVDIGRLRLRCDAQRILGACMIELVERKENRQKARKRVTGARVAVSDEQLLVAAESNLMEALARSRRANLVINELDVLLTLARCYQSWGKRTQAWDCLREATAGADRCKYRLMQADAHNLAALLQLQSGSKEEAHRHALLARERALCSGGSYSYEPALKEARRLIRATAS